MRTVPTREQRQAAIGLWLLGGLNLFTALPVVLGGQPMAQLPQARTLAAVSLVTGIIMIGLGFGTRLGNRPAMVGATVLLAVFAAYQVYGLIATRSLGALLPLLITGLLLSLVVRGLQD